MADLYDRIHNNNPDNETPQITTHSLTAALVLYSEGHFTSQQIINYYNFDALAQVDWNALVTNIDAESLVANKLRRLHRLEAAGVATEHGAITTKAEYKSAAGIT